MRGRWSILTGLALWLIPALIPALVLAQGQGAVAGLTPGQSLQVAVAGAGSGGPAVVLARHPVRPRTVISAGDLALGPAPPGQGAGALTDPGLAIGREARVALYPGRPVRAGDLQAPALIERNETVRMSYHRGALRITVDGRSLERAALGARLRVLNLSSKSVVTATVTGPGTVEAGR